MDPNFDNPSPDGDLPNRLFPLLSFPLRARNGSVLMQLHQTPKRSPRRVVVPSFRLLFLAFLLLVTACGTADDFSEDVAFIETDTVELDAGADGAVEPAGSADVPQVGQTGANPAPADQQTELQGDQQTDQQAERPVLEVTSDQSTDQESVAATGAATGQSTDGAVATTTEGQSADGESVAGEQPATTTAQVTQPTDAVTTTTAPPQTEPPATDPPETVAPAPPPTEAPVTVAPPAATNEPNCGVSCNIAMEGDSLTVGLGNRLCGAVKTGNCINSGIVGRRVDEMIVSARSDVDNQVGSEGNDVLILWGGTNDLWQKFHSTDPATNAAAIYEQIKIFVSERRASGWDYIYVMTLPPMNPTYVVGTEPLNDLIRQNSAGANGVLDVGADGRLANAFDPAMRAADGIHFGDGGRAVVMEYILGAIAELDGA